jgi:hypothetical protein
MTRFIICTASGALSATRRAEIARAIHQLGIREDPVHQTDPFRLPRIHEVAGPKHGQGARHADQPRQKIGTTGAGDQPQLRVGLGEAGAFRCEAEVASQRDVEPTPGCDPRSGLR